MSERAYFDWNATAPLREEARTALVQALALTGNASSVHGEGRAVRRLVEEARIAVAALVGGRSEERDFHQRGDRGQHAGADAGVADWRAQGAP